TVTDLAKSYRFLTRLYEIYNSDSAPKSVAKLTKPADLVLRSYDTLPKMKQGALGKQLADRLEALHKKEAEEPAVDLNKGLKVHPKKDETLDSYLKSVKLKAKVDLTDKLRRTARDLRRKALKAVPDMKGHAKTIAETKPTRPDTPLAKATDAD